MSTPQPPSRQFIRPAFKFNFTILLCLLFLSRASSPALSSPLRLSAADHLSRAENVIQIGVAVDLSGPAESLGWPEANSAQLAADQINAAGGVDVGGVNYSVQLIYADSAGDDAAVVAAAQSLVDAGAVAVIGHATSRECKLAQPIYFAAGVAMVSPSSTGPDVTHLGYSTTFRMPSHDGTPGKILAEYFRDQGFSRSSLVEDLYPLATDAYADAFTALGGVISGRHKVSDPMEFPSLLAAIQAEEPDIIVNFSVLFDGDIMGDFSRQAYELGMADVPIGWHIFESQETVLAPYREAAGAAAAEEDFAVFREKRFRDMPGYLDFRPAYQAALFDHYPDSPTIYGVFAYDALFLILDAVQRAGSLEPAGIRDAIADTQDFSGVYGVYRGFDRYGDILPQLGWIMGFHDGRWLQDFPRRLYLPVTVR